MDREETTGGGIVRAVSKTCSEGMKISDEDETEWTEKYTSPTAHGCSARQNKMETTRILHT